jgi:hypothetical protein
MSWTLTRALFSPAISSSQLKDEHIGNPELERERGGKR